MQDTKTMDKLAKELGAKRLDVWLLLLLLRMFADAEFERNVSTHELGIKPDLAG